MILVVSQAQDLCVTLASESKDILGAGRAAVLGRKIDENCYGSLGSGVVFSQLGRAHAIQRTEDYRHVRLTASVS